MQPRRVVGLRLVWKVSPLKLILICLLLSREKVFRIAIKDLLLGLVDGFEHLDFTKNLVLFLFTFQVKAANLCNNSNDAAFSRFHRKAVNNSGLICEADKGQ